MVIDHLEPGGAQRQFCLLATSLRRFNFQVEVFTLRADFFFKYLLDGDPPIYVNHVAANSRIQLYVRLRRSLRRFRPAAVVSFLSWPNLLVELCRIPRRSFCVIVSERNIDRSAPGFRRRFRYMTHRLADAVVSNSYAQARLITRIDCLLKSRTTVIPNAVDTNYFRPPQRSMNAHSRTIYILVLARLAPQKNPIRLIEAVSALRSRRPDLSIDVDWYGKLPTSARASVPRWNQAVIRRDLAYYQSVKDAISAHALEECFRIHGPLMDVRPLYHQSDVLCLPSIYEGYPNVIAEAMACGLPVLASAVGDAHRLVDHERSGYLFDPLSVRDIIDTIVRFSELSARDRRKLGAAGRSIAESLLSVETYTSRYVGLIRRLTKNYTKQ